MEINIYRTYEEWMNEAPTYTVEGDVDFWRNGLVLLKTYEKSQRYEEVLSAHQVFAITYAMPSGFLMYYDNIHLYKEAASWEASQPEVTLEGQMTLDECTNNYVSLLTKDGYKQIIFMKQLFAVTNERK
ncbi:MAG: hypothetical protein ACRCW2_06805 [Cellulosilyticaceae bacterium]